MNGRDPWAGLGPVELEVRCGAGQHRVRWEAGALTALDHGDLDAEAVLVGLGAAPARCVDLVRWWLAHADDLRALTLGPRWPGDRLTITSELVAEVAAQQQRRRRNPAQAALAARHLELLELFALGPGMTQRLLVTVGQRWAGRLRAGAAEEAAPPPELEAALTGRALAALTRWAPAGRRLAVVASPDPAAAAIEAEGASVTFTVGLDWLTWVWGRRLDVIDKRLTIAVEALDERGALVRALPAWPASEPAPPGPAELLALRPTPEEGWAPA